MRAAAGADLVINARVDTFLADGTPADAVARGRGYRRAGADCIYPIFAPIDVLPELVAEIGGPINAHAQAERADTCRADRGRAHTGSPTGPVCTRI